MNRATSDPLQALGPSTFISILSYLPFSDILACDATSRRWRATIKAHEKGIWRETCHRTGVDRSTMSMLIALEENTATTSGGWGEGDPEEPERFNPDESMNIVGWRSFCKAHVKHDRNWRWGRCRERWVTPLSNSVWRIKVDHEEETIISTSRLSGLIVTDLKTSAPLFILHDLHGWAHLEFAKGFVIFDADHDDDTGLYVYRTQQAISRSAHPNPPSRRPHGALYGESISTDIDMTTHTGRLPRGHVAYYRHIIPPTDCIAFRARVDNLGKPNERAVLGTAGEEGVYLWDLDDPERVERIMIPLEQRQRIQYIEFDEDYVFLCSPESLRIYSRRTRQLVSQFPEEERKILQCASIGYDLLLDNEPDWASLIVKRPEERDDFYLSTPVAALDVPVVSAEQQRSEAISGPRVFWNRLTYTPRKPSFNACHYTPTDLICTAMSGIILIVRDYRAVLEIEDEGERKAKLRDHTIWLGLGHRVNLLATHDTRVSIATSQAVYWFDTSTLPSLPFDPAQTPTIRVYRICSTHPFGVENVGCLQMDRSNIYLGYCAVGEEVADGVPDPETGEILRPDPNAVVGVGCCVRIWNFTP